MSYVPEPTAEESVVIERVVLARRPDLLGCATPAWSAIAHQLALLGFTERQWNSYPTTHKGECVVRALHYLQPPTTTKPMPSRRPWWRRLFRR